MGVFGRNRGFDFEFTHEWAVASSLIDYAWYDENSQTVLFALAGGRKYAYHNVPLSAVEDIVDASSPGRAYNQFRKYRPANQAGTYADDWTPVARKVSNYRQTAVAPVTGPVSLKVGNKEFSVTYFVDKSEFTSVVKANDLVDACQKIQDSFGVLGLPANLTKVEARR